MGLTIHYQLRTSLTRMSDIRVLVEALRQAALKLPFKHVSRLVQFEGKNADFAYASENDPFLWLKIQAGQYVHLENADIPVKPLHIVGFSTWPGDGCEPANFGLCRYPGTALDPQSKGRTLPTRLDGWRWQSFCKTQYASDPSYGGLANFLRCHLAVINLLDAAKGDKLFDVEVADESGFWEHRDLERLSESVGTWNELVAAVAGMAKDFAEADGTKLRSAIANFPNFEHLEAKGLERLRLLREPQD